MAKDFPDGGDLYCSVCGAVCAADRYCDGGKRARLLNSGRSRAP